MSDGKTLDEYTEIGDYDGPEPTQISTSVQPFEPAAGLALSSYSTGGAGILNLAAAMQIGRILAASHYFRDAQQESQAIAKVLAGVELGIPPVAAMTGIFVIKGRITLSANLIAALVVRSGKYRVRPKEWSNTACILEFFTKDNGDWYSLGESSFTMKDAELAELKNGDNWRKYPRNMLYSRAISNGARMYCPDIFIGGVYTVEEMDELPTLTNIRDEQDEGGEVEKIDL